MPAPLEWPTWSVRCMLRGDAEFIVHAKYRFEVQIRERGGEEEA